jgi:hypothetical protein
MKRKIMAPLAAIAGVFTLLAIVTAPVSAGEQVPFKASYAGSIQITGADSAGNPTMAAYGGQGVGSHLGNGRMDGSIAVTGPAPSCGAAGGFTAQHTDTLTAADGSKLVLQVNEVACQVTPGTFHCSGTYTVISGTGRFANSTGQGAFDGLVSFNPDGSGTFNASYAGTISVAQ